MRARLLLIACLAAAAPAAAQPARDVTPLHYQLTVTPDLAKATFEGDLWIDLQVAVPTTRITLDSVDLEIRDALIQLPYDRQVDPTIQVDAAAGIVTFTTPTRLYPGAIKLHVEYAGKLRSDGRGFYLVESRGHKYLLSQMESTDARRAFPCADTPAIKSSFALTAIIGSGLTAISNGKVLSDKADPTGRRAVRFSTTPKMPTYLVGLAVGDFTCLEGSAASIPVRLCTAPERKGAAPFAFEVAQRALQADAKYFTTRYPFTKLDLVAVPGGFPGAMENAGAIFFDEGLLVDPASAPDSTLAETSEVLSHEIAHQWLGNLVTMKWWDDLWLNEGLATWLAPKALEEWKPGWRADASRVASTSEAMRLDSLRSSRPVRAVVTTEAEIEESFDAIAYQKAAAVAGMIESWIGEHAFRDGLNAYVREHAYGSATGEDLWTRLASSSGLPVDQVMRAFLTRPGVPLVTVDSRCDAGETIVDVSVRRFVLDGSPTEAEAPWPVPLLVRGVSPTAPMFSPVARLVTQPRDSFRVLGCFQAVLVNSGATGYFYSAYSPAALTYLASVAQARMTTAERVRLLGDEWALVAAGVHEVGEYLSLVQAMAGDPTPQVVEAASLGLASIGSDLVDERARKGFEAWIALVFGPLASQLGWRAAPDDTPDRRRLRAAVLEIVGGVGRDPAILEAARTLAAAGGAAEKADPVLEPTITRLAARTADAALLERLREREASAALGETADAAFVTRALAEALKSGDQGSVFPNALAAALRNPAVHGEVWRFLTSRWGEIQPRLDGAFAFSTVVSAAGSFCDGAARDDVRKFFAGKTPVTRTLDLALERIDACRDMRLRQQTALTAWLAKQ